ncbi:hypothetical protein CJF32_00006701 [Rutstroemia sp. NJR-2017a WRK4]|nr:hypothetical protein CJF32_00006701 [Rutstroemia sp. NJR-2017a WRK4]
MSPYCPHIEVESGDSTDKEFDDAEKGMNVHMQSLPIAANVDTTEKPSRTFLSPRTLNSEGTTPSSSIPVLLLPLPAENQVTDTTGLPPVSASRHRWILFLLWFNTYRKFFVSVTLLNLAGIIMAALHHFPYAENHLGALALGNLLCAVIMRNELFLRILYLIAIYGLRSNRLIKESKVGTLMYKIGSCFDSPTCGRDPFWVRRFWCCNIVNKPYSWLLYNIINIIQLKTTEHCAVIATGIITNLFVIISILSAFPWIRKSAATDFELSYHHNVFEKYHRFIGWLGLAVTWCFVILGNTYDVTLRQWRTDVYSLLSLQELWFAVFMTVFVLIPWFTLREVPVEVEVVCLSRVGPSPKVAILRFNRGMQQGLLGRISRTTIMEYHAFGIISEGRKSGCHYMICGVQGDFTKTLVQDPPKTVWTRELKFGRFAFLPLVSAMHPRCSKEESGSAPELVSGQRYLPVSKVKTGTVPVQSYRSTLNTVLGSDQESTFGPTISGLIYNNIEPERMILWDSKKRGGRPDTMQLLIDTWKSFGAEVIFITSNMKGNDEMMQGCRAGGFLP